MINILISKADTVLEVDWDAMPDNAKMHIIEYGLRQKLNDAGSQFKIGHENYAENALSAAENVLSALMEGKVTVRQAGVAMTLEERAFAKVVKALFKKVFKKKLEDMDTSEAIDKIAEKLGVSRETLEPKIQAKADLEAEAMRKIAALKSDIPDIEI